MVDRLEVSRPRVTTDEWYPPGIFDGRDTRIVAALRGLSLVRRGGRQTPKVTADTLHPPGIFLRKETGVVATLRGPTPVRRVDYQVPKLTASG